MAQEYTIEKVSQQEPKKYEGQYGTTYYIKVKLAGHDKPVSIGKKQPDALKEGYKVFGTIEPTDFDEDKFKSEKNPNSSYGGSKSSYQPRDDEAIRAQWAIGQAVQLYSFEAKEHELGPHMNLIEAKAKELFSMVDRVKGLKVEERLPAEKPPKVDPVFDIDEDEEINLDDIPF